MLTPQEIQDQKFEKAVFGGYDMGQIDKFLDAVLSDYTSLYKENAALKAKMRVLVDKIEEYRAVDEELRKTLYNAQIAAKDTVSRAQAEAERILREAQEKAAKMVADAEARGAALCENTETETVAAAKEVIVQLRERAETMRERLDTEAKEEAAEIVRQASLRKRSAEKIVIRGLASKCR